MTRGVESQLVGRYRTEDDLSERVLGVDATGVPKKMFGVNEGAWNLRVFPNAGVSLLALLVEGRAASLDLEIQRQSTFLR